MHHHHTSWLQQSLEKIWYQQQGKGTWFLLPFTLLYCAIHSYQRWKLTRRRSKANLPVIVVGNISIGGTGKTPTVIYLATVLKNAGYKPGIITRGYGGQSAKWPKQVTALSNPEQVGDEAVLLAKRTSVPVVAGPDRYVDIQYLKSKYKCDVILSDDGLQHYNLHRDIEIVLVDAERELGNGWCLPAGPLRESACRLKEVDFVLYNNGFKPENNRHVLFAKHYQLRPVFPQSLSGEMLQALSIKEGSRSITRLKGTTVHAVTGIGNPARFYNTLEHYGLILIKHSFPDHHDFKKKDLGFQDNKLIIMTEKDAVKCREFAPERCWYLPIDAHIEGDFDQLLLDTLRKKNG
jgi:tetraacyldisaccharide 4'-kinase